MTTDTDAQRALTEMGRVVDGLTRELNEARLDAAQNMAMLQDQARVTGDLVATAVENATEDLRAKLSDAEIRGASLDLELEEVRAKLAEAERERDAANRAVQDVAVTQREACASHLYEREQYGRRPHELAGIVRETPLVTGEAPKREWIWMLGHYGVQWYDPAGGVEKELARWDDEPAKLPVWRYDVTGREIRVGDWVDSELVLDGPRQVVSVSNDTWIHLSGGEVLANQRGSKLVSHLRIVDPPEQPATEDYPPPSKLDCNGREVKIGSWVVPIDCAVSDPVPYQANYVGPELRAGRLRVVDEAEMKLRAELQAAQARIAEHHEELVYLRKELADAVADRDHWYKLTEQQKQDIAHRGAELAESKKRCETAEARTAPQWALHKKALEDVARLGSELAALRKREADKLSAIAADIAPLNPPAPDSTVRRDGMACTCGESERRWHLRDCPMSSAGKAQRKEGEK